MVPLVVLLAELHCKILATVDKWLLNNCSMHTIKYFLWREDCSIVKQALRAKTKVWQLKLAEIRVKIQV